MLAPFSVNVPVPDFVIEPVPLTAPEMVVRPLPLTVRAKVLVFTAPMVRTLAELFVHA